MRVLKNSYLLFLLLSVVQVCAQQRLPRIVQEDSVIVSSWIFGLGFNAVDDAGSEFGNLLNISDNWNLVPYPSRLSIGRYFKGGLGLEAIGSYNRYQEGKIIDGNIATEDIDYFAVDVRASYDLNQVFGYTGWFDPYIGLGAGYTDANNQGRGTYNATIGFRAWFSEHWGLDFNSTGKWSANRDNATNHLQHAFGVVYQFGIEKALSKAEEEHRKYAEASARAEQRVQDSLAAIQEVEQEARRLAKELRQKEETDRLVALEKAKEAAESERQNQIAQAISDLGQLYFDLNSSYLNSDNKKVLDALAKLLLENEGLAIEISAHADARGTDIYNQWLSERRANRAIVYLVKKGVSEERLKGFGFGEQHLSNDCDNRIVCTEDEHRENRRTEFTVLYGISSALFQTGIERNQ